MDFHLPLTTFREKTAGLDRDAFHSKYKDPFLLIDMGQEDMDAGAFQTLDGTAKPDRPTEPISRRTGKPASAMAVPMVKSDRNTFENMVTLGRASNNDVVVPHPSISKFHAFFRIDGTSGSVSDAGSSYGTILNGRELGKGESAPLESGSTLQFAKSVTAKFYSPSAFYEFLSDMG
ncbi:MAG: FHA domain-containing protein [Planctomycetota bacterium]|jgi:pSer/pThr/pTyr-binding forkhead associated (FHA) protein